MKEKVTIGLDVGHRHINMVKLSKETQALRLLDFASVGLGHTQAGEERLNQLTKVVKEKEIAASLVNIGISGESVVVRYIDLPKMSRSEVGQALKYEAQQYIPFKMEEVVFDYHILEPLNSERNRMKMLLVAAKRKAIMESVEFIKGAGLKPQLIDVTSFSLINCFQLNGPEIKVDDIYALVNLEFDLVNINILQGQVPFFTRDIPLLEDISHLRAERGFASASFEMLRPVLANLVREIRLSIDYFESEFEKQVSVIYLSGEGAKIPKLIDFFEAQLGRQISLWNSVQNLIVDATVINPEALKQTQSMLALACGLALRKLR